MKLSVVMPVFNEEAVLEMTNTRVSGLLLNLKNRGIIEDYEMIYVDDGSCDDSIGILKKISRDSSRIKVLSFSRNFGHQPALAAGILHSTGDAVVSLDADLQDPPELIEKMIAKYRLGNDIVYGVRRTRRKDTLFKRCTARFFYKTMKLMGVELIYDHADYRLISRKVAEAFRTVGEVNVFLRGIFPFLGFKHEIVFYDREERLAGETKYPLHKMIAFACEGITSFSSVPLRMVSVIGIIIFLGSLGLSIWAFYRNLIDSTVPGWTSIVIPLFFIGGLNILFLGLIGEYTGRIYLEVKKRPLFIIKEKFNVGDDTE